MKVSHSQHGEHVMKISIDESDRWLIASALRKKAEGDAEAADDCSDLRTLAFTLREQARNATRLADAFEGAGSITLEEEF